MSAAIDKNAIIFPGAGETPDSIWIPYAAGKL